MPNPKTDKVLNTRRERLNFSKIPVVIEIPNLIEIQKKSFEYFLQTETTPKDRKGQGLEEVFQDVFPISDLNINARLEYVGYEIGIWECGCGEYSELGGPGVVCPTCGEPTVFKEKYKQSECRQKGLTYSDPIKIMVRMVLFDRERIDLNARVLKELPGKYLVEEVKRPDTGKTLFPARTPIDQTVVESLQKEKVAQVVINSVREVKEQKIFLGEMPLMSNTGTFMINGVERVIVSQMHRSPGAFFTHDKGKSHISGKLLYSCRVIPDRGSWLDFEYDIKDILHVKIDRRRKLPATVLLYAFGMNQEEILAAFYTIEKVSQTLKDGRVFMNNKNLMVGAKVLEDVVDPKTDEVLIKSGKKVTPAIFKKLSKVGRSSKVEIDRDSLLGLFLAEDLIDKDTGEVVAESNQEVIPEARHLTSEIPVLRVPHEGYLQQKKAEES